jgi:hypothetical protein
MVKVLPLRPEGTNRRKIKYIVPLLKNGINRIILKPLWLSAFVADLLGKKESNDSFISPSV